MPILGIIASSFRSAGGGPEGAYDALATVTVGSTALSSVTFSGIPTGYKHLQLRYVSRGSISATFTNVNVRFNGDTGNNYITHWLDGNGTSASGENSGTTSLIYLGVGTGANANASVFGAGVFDFLDYASTNKNKTCRALAGEDNNGSGFLGLISGLWVNTSAVTTIDIFPNSGTFSQYSQFALYGIK
jgi:hypothetical protein